MSVVWVDGTSYRQGERGTVEPRAWEICAGRLRMTIHRLHGIEGQWFLTCNELGIERQPLTAATPIKAKAEALTHVRRRLRELVDAFAEIKQAPR